MTPQMRKNQITVVQTREKFLSHFSGSFTGASSLLLAVLPNPQHIEGPRAHLMALTLHLYIHISRGQEEGGGQKVLMLSFSFQEGSLDTLHNRILCILLVRPKSQVHTYLNRGRVLGNEDSWLGETSKKMAAWMLGQYLAVIFNFHCILMSKCL